MTLEDRLERLATRTPPGDPADVLAAARARAEAGTQRSSRSPRILAAAAAVAVVALAAGAIVLVGDDGGTADVATGPDTPGTVAPDGSGQQQADGPTVRVEAAGLPTLDVRATPLRPSDAADTDGWLDHTITMDNTGPDPVHLNDFRTGTVLGDREVLAATDGCGYGSVLSEPAIPACRQNYQPVTIEPGATYQFDVTLWRDLDGMNPVTVGSYRWGIEIRVGSEPFANPRTPSGEVATVTVHYDGLAEAADAEGRTDPQGGLDVPVIFAPRRDNAGSEYALLAGTLTRSGHCLYLANGLAGRYVIVWPHGTTWDADREGAVLPDGGFLPVGEQFTASGGFHGFSEFPDLPVDAARLAESCSDPNTDSAAVIQSTGVDIGGLDQDAVAYAFGDKSIIEHYDDLKRVVVRVEPGLGRSERLAAVLSAAAVVEGNVQPALSSSAVPAVSVDGTVAVLDWDSEAASRELSAWSTSSGSSGLNLVLGMVFDNDPAVETVEMRLDGSCQLFTETMQGGGCETFSRERWAQIRNG